MIDTHQHLLYPVEFSYGWAKDFPTLQGNFRIEEYRAAAKDCGIEATIFMEVDVDEGQSSREAGYFCRLADDAANGIRGVVAAARPEREDCEEDLKRIAHPKLKGIRRVLHTQPDALSQSRVFRQNIALLGRLGLTFDLCVLQRQLGVALDLVRACPGTTFILDHCGVPDIAGNEAPHGPGFAAWQAAISGLAREENVHGKISGLTAYARPDQRSVEGLGPYIDTMLGAFGPGRLVWGGDWPVCNLGGGLKPWVEITRELLAPLSEPERAQILTGTAKKTYRIP
jgi:predicted TIM-barrel fold metal-dependent hydrolase